MSTSLFFMTAGKRWSFGFCRPTQWPLSPNSFRILFWILNHWIVSSWWAGTEHILLTETHSFIHNTQFSFLSLPHPAYYCPRIQTQNITLGLSIVHLHRHSFYSLSLSYFSMPEFFEPSHYSLHCNLSFCLCAVISHLVTTTNIGTYKNVLSTQLEHSKCFLLQVSLKYSQSPRSWSSKGLGDKVAKLL